MAPEGSASIHRVQTVIGEVREALRDLGLDEVAQARWDRPAMDISERSRSSLMAFEVELEGHVRALAEAKEAIADELRRLDCSVFAAGAYQRTIAQTRRMRHGARD